MMHTMYYADEIRSVEDVDRGLSAEAKPAELDLAKRLIADLTQNKFDPAKYHDSYRERVLEAAQRKLEGQEVTEAPTEERRGKVIDLMAALKASLEKRGVSIEEAEPAQCKAAASKTNSPRLTLAPTAPPSANVPAGKSRLRAVQGSI
jgi:DNA end-binding protein Ku